MTVDLANYDNRGYHPGRGALVRTLWYVCNAFLLASWLLPLSGHIVAAAMVHRVPLVVTLNGDDFKDFSAHITCLKPAEAVERLAKKRMWRPVPSPRRRFLLSPPPRLASEGVGGGPALGGGRPPAER